MNQKKFIEFITKVEQEFPVNDLTCDDVIVWPIIRLWLLNDHSKATIPHKLSRFGCIVHACRSFKRYITGRPKFNALLNKLKEHNVSFSFSICNGKFQLVNGAHFSKFTDSIRELGHFDHLYEIGEGYEHSGVIPHSEPVLFDNTISYVMFWQHLKQVFTGSEERIYVANLESFLVYLKGNDYESRTQLHVLIYWLRHFKRYKKVFRCFLRQTHPVQVYLSCYYHIRGFALTSVCRELGIKTVEVQHGQQGDVHPMYSNWSVPPKHGYDLLPQYFWMWGDKSVERIDKWARKSDYHRALLGGNPWLTYNCFTETSHNMVGSFYGMLNAFEGRRVLVSLQPCSSLEDTLTDFIIEAMNISQNIFWCIRLHPGMMAQKKQIIDRLAGIDIGKYNINDSTSIQLYTLLKMVDVNITGWSSIAYEALCFDVPTIITHENGCIAMKEYIKKGIFCYANDSSSILTSIAKLDFKDEADYGGKYIHTSQSIFDEAISYLE